jgi:hypothetical protein
MKSAMATEIEYRSRAKECIELAILARSPEQRIMLQHIAETWVRLADEQVHKGGISLFESGTVHAKA